MTQNEIGSFGATRLAVGLSTILKIQPGPYWYYMNIRQVGGSSLEIVDPPLALSGSSASGWGAGYLMGATQVVESYGPAVMYLAATGATANVHLLIGKTMGASIPV